MPKIVGKQGKAPSSHSRHRSNMMLNPLNLKHLNAIDSSNADVITINLEDAIAPARKKEALENISIFLSHLEASKSTIVVRTNALDNGGADEIRFLNTFSFDAIRIPKVRQAKEVKDVLKILSDEKELHLSLETKEAFHNIASLRVDERVTTANLGILDLLTSLNLPQSLVTQGNPTIDYILSKFLIESLSVSIHPVSFMYQAYQDVATFEKWCNYEKSMGYTSKACMGPKQVEIANKVFNIENHAVQRAEEIKALFEKHAHSNNTGFMHETHGFIDEPIYRDSLLILKQNKELQ